MDINEYRLKNQEYLITTNIEPIVKCIDISVKDYMLNAIILKKI